MQKKDLEEILVDRTDDTYAVSMGQPEYGRELGVASLYIDRKEVFGFGFDPTNNTTLKLELTLPNKAHFLYPKQDRMAKNIIEGFRNQNLGYDVSSKGYAL